MSKLSEVLITISNKQTADRYLCKSFPDLDIDNNELMELYPTPVYKLFIENTGKSKAEKKEWKALRFYPYWNDPKALDIRYKKTKGWVNAGLWRFPKTKVTYYDPSYETHNTDSPYKGAIKIPRKGSYYIHAGPKAANDRSEQWGAAGCIEVIGNFNDFKEDIIRMSGIERSDKDEAIKDLIRLGKLFVKIEFDKPPRFRRGTIWEIPIRDRKSQE
jgi:hypothetical protein